MSNRNLPYSSFNFLVDLGGLNTPTDVLGGFAEVSGLGVELTIQEYRNGNEPENHPRKVVGMHKVPDVTLKRGIVSSEDLWGWINEARRDPVSAQKTVVVTMRDEGGKDVQSWTLRNTVPMKYTGPSLNAKGGGDVAMEELVLSAEGIDFN